MVVVARSVRWLVVIGRFMILPATGLHVNVPDPTYRAWDAVNQSSLKDWRTPRHLQINLTSTREDTRSLAFGRAFHAAVLEPGVFESKYVPSIDADNRTKAYQEWRATQDAAGKEIMDAVDYHRIDDMATAIRAKSKASALLKLPGPCEAAALWADPRTGIMCKAKIDKLCIDANIIVDFKTTNDASQDAFANSIDKYGYDLQAYWYTQAVLATTGKTCAFVIVAVEKDDPYGVACYDMTPWLGYGEAKAKRALDTIAHYRNNTQGPWPSYADSIEPLPVPYWIERKHVPYTNPWPTQADEDHPF